MMGTGMRLGIRIGRRLKIPVVSFYHTNYLQYLNDYKELSWLRRFTHSWSDSLLSWLQNSYLMTLTSSSATKEYLEGLKITNICYKPFIGINVARFMAKPRSPVDKKCIKLLYVGRLTADKRIEFLLKVFSAFEERSPGRCSFTVIGEGYLAPLVQAWAEGHENRHFPGAVPNETIAACYAASDVFVTVSPWETLGITVMEAMASHLPIIAPLEGGIREMVRDGVDGILMPSATNIGDYVLAVKSLADNHERRRQMGEAAAARVEHFTIEATTQRIINTWDEAIAIYRSHSTSLPVSKA